MAAAAAAAAVADELAVAVDAFDSCELLFVFDADDFNEFDKWLFAGDELEFSLECDGLDETLSELELVLGDGDDEEVDVIDALVEVTLLTSLLCCPFVSFMFNEENAVAIGLGCCCCWLVVDSLFVA